MKISGTIEIHSKIKPTLRGFYHILIGKPLLVEIKLEDVPVVFSDKSEKCLKIHK